MGSAQFTWGDCWAVVNALPYDSPLSRAQQPDEWFWGHPLSQHIVNAGEMANAYKGVLAKKYNMKQKDLYPTPRPGQVKKTKIAADVHDVATMRELLDFTI